MRRQCYRNLSYILSIGIIFSLPTEQQCILFVCASHRDKPPNHRSVNNSERLSSVSPFLSLSFAQYKQEYNETINVMSEPENKIRSISRLTNKKQRHAETSAASNQRSANIDRVKPIVLIQCIKLDQPHTSCRCGPPRPHRITKKI